MIVNFHILKGAVSWSSTIHQLNSDVLLRHIRFNSHLNEFDFDFSFCEEQGKGQVWDKNNQKVGDFSICS